MNELVHLINNVYIIKDEQMPVANLLELKYWKNILEELFTIEIDKQFHNVRFYLVFGNKPIEVPNDEDILNVFLIADEHQTLTPGIYNGKNIIFQSSYSPEVFKNKYLKIYEFPVGYNGKLNLNNATPFLERKTNVFFSGNLHRGRAKMFDFYSHMRLLPFFVQHRLQGRIKTFYDNKYPSSYIRFTNGFMQGLRFDEYASYLKNCKIVLSPRGSIVAECFRHYEAMKCGCIIVSERLPENHFFSGSPIIQIDNWKDADRIIKDLLSNPIKMQDLHVAALKWWHDVMSEPAVARYMAEIISNNQLPKIEQ